MWVMMVYGLVQFLIIDVVVSELCEMVVKWLLLVVFKVMCCLVCGCLLIGLNICGCFSISLMGCFVWCVVIVVNIMCDYIELLQLNLLFMNGYIICSLLGDKFSVLVIVWCMFEMYCVLLYSVSELFFQIVMVVCGFMGLCVFMGVLQMVLMCCVVWVMLMVMLLCVVLVDCVCILLGECVLVWVVLKLSCVGC